MTRKRADGVPEGDTALLERCRAGDEAAWEEVYHLVLRICRWPRWRLGDRADDLAGTTILWLVEKGISQVREPAAFRAYVRSATTSRILDHLRSPAARLEKPLATDDEERPAVEKPDPGPSPYRALMGKEGTEVILNAVRDLGQPCREILDAYLAFRTGLVPSYKDLEKALGNTANNIATQVRRCLERLRRDPRLVELADARGQGEVR